MKNTISRRMHRVYLSLAALGLLGAVAAKATPSGNPVVEFGPQQLLVGFYFDHSGQEVFNDNTPSVFNTTGLNIGYAPWKFLQVGGFIGVAEFDVAKPQSKRHIDTVGSFNSDYRLHGGGSLKLVAPIWESLSIFGSGSGAYHEATDGLGNYKEVRELSGAAGMMWRFGRLFNVAMGAEYFLLDGEQRNNLQHGVKFANLDQYRGLLALEFFPPHSSLTSKGIPYISLSFRPTGSIGWNDRLGLQNASIAISLGFISDLSAGEGVGD